MSEILADLAYYNNLFQDGDLPIKEQAATIKWSERKCYVYKFFIATLSESEIEIIKKSSIEPNYELIGAISIHNPEMRIIMLNQLQRIENSESPFEEIKIISNENAAPNPLNSIRKEYWIAVRSYLEQREYDTYPFNSKSRNFLKDVARIGYPNLSTAQFRYINGLIENDRTRPESDHFFVNDYLIKEGFEVECQAIKTVWANH